MTVPPVPPAVREERCDLTELLPAHCGCRNHRKPAAEPAGHVVSPGRFGRSIVAQYGGRCPGCDGGIDLGEYIRFDAEPDDDRDGLWWHTRCTEGAS